MNLQRYLAVFAEDLHVFALALRPGHDHLASGLEVMSVALPTLVGPHPFVVADSPLHTALSLTAAMLASTRATGASPGRAVDRLERRLNRLFEIGSAIEPKRRRPRPVRRRAPRRLRAFSSIRPATSRMRG